MRQAFGLSGKQFIINLDPLSIGPTPYSSEIEVWRRPRDEYLENYLGYDGPDTLPPEFRESSFLDNLDRLEEENTLFVWAAAGLSEQLNVAFVLHWLKQIGKDFSSVLVVPVDFDFGLGKVAGIGTLSLEHFKVLESSARNFQPPEIESYLGAWAAYTSSEVSSLTSYLSRDSDYQALSNAMRSLVGRFPSQVTGLSRLEDELLSSTGKGDRKVRDVVGHAIAHGDNLDPLPDVYVLQRLLGLADENLSTPLVNIEGESLDPWGCDASLTSFGRQVLGRDANNLHENEVDDWVGGFHLISSVQFPLRHNGKLIAS